MDVRHINLIGRLVTQSLSSLNLIGQTVFELESGNDNVDKQMDGQANGQTNRLNFTNFERNLAMMAVYVRVKYGFDWTNCFQVRVQKQKCGQMDGQINGQKTDKRTDGISPILTGT